MELSVLTKEGLEYFKTKIQALIPTKLSQLTNDSNFVDKDTADTSYVKKDDAYTLPAATTSTLGGIKVGTNLAITDDGTLSVDGIPVSSEYISDADNFSTTGFAKTNTSTTNLPDACNDGQVWADGRWGILQFVAENKTAGNGTQLYYPIAGSTMSNIYVRSHGALPSGVSGWSDWEQLLKSSDAYTLPEATTTTLGGIKVGDNLSISNGILSATSPDLSGYIKSTDLAAVATSGSYSDLSNKPTIPTSLKNPSSLTITADTNTVYDGSEAKTIDLSVYAKSNSLASVATSGSYTDLTDKPTIPSAYTLPTASSSTLGGIKVGSGLSISSGTLNVSSAPKATTDADGNTISTTYAKTANLAAVATSGSYTDLTDKPTIPSAYTLPTASSSTLGGIKVGTNLSISNGVLSATNTTYSNASSSSAGLMSATDKTKLDGITTSADAVSFTQSLTSGTKIGTLTINGTSTNLYSTNNTTYSDMTGATSSISGTHGLVPAPASGKQTSFLRGDGTWAIPANTTYSTATTSTSGLMSASDKSKLDTISSGANNYTLPTASSSTLGGIKVGTGLSISDGVLSAATSSYTLPTASSTTLGGIKVGTGLSISNGVLSASTSSYTLPIATSSTLGGIKSSSGTGAVTVNSSTGVATVSSVASAAACTGNAATATKAAQLTTARTINISDATAAHTGTGASFNGTANATIKLPATITANIIGDVTGTASKATADASGNTISTTYAKSASLATVATTGKYSDLSDTPTIPAVTVSGNTISFGSVTIGVD